MENGYQRDDSSAGKESGTFPEKEPRSEIGRRLHRCE